MNDRRSYRHRRMLRTNPLYRLIWDTLPSKTPNLTKQQRLNIIRAYLRANFRKPKVLDMRVNQPRDELGRFAPFEQFPSGVMSGKKVVKFLERQGFELKNITGSHHKYENPATGKVIEVPKHGGRDLKKGTIGSIKRQYNNAIK